MLIVFIRITKNPETRQIDLTMSNYDGIEPRSFSSAFLQELEVELILNTLLADPKISYIIITFGKNLEVLRKHLEKPVKNEKVIIGAYIWI